MGTICVVLGAWFNYNASRADPDLKERFSLPWREALEPSPGTPSRLKPMGDMEIRAQLSAIGVAVAGAKMGPVLWRFGTGGVLVGVVGFLIS